MKYFVILILTIILFLLDSSSFLFASSSQKIPIYNYKIIKTYSHYPNAFTEGLVCRNNQLYESSGLYGVSKIITYDLKTDTVTHIEQLPKEIFAEGIAIVESKLYLLLYELKQYLVFDAKTFKKISSQPNVTKGWGLTTNGRELIMSDGSPTIYFVDMKSNKLNRTINVHDQGRLIHNVNALMYKNDVIYANIWLTNFIAIIDAKTGEIKGWINVTGLTLETFKDPENVLNGIAQCDDGDLIITGKRWHQIYKIRIK